MDVETIKTLARVANSEDRQEVVAFLLGYLEKQMPITNGKHDAFMAFCTELERTDTQRTHSTTVVTGGRTVSVLGLSVGDKIYAPAPFTGQAEIIGFRYYTGRHTGRTALVADYVLDCGGTSFDPVEKLRNRKINV